MTGDELVSIIREDKVCIHSLQVTKMQATLIGEEVVDPQPVGRPETAEVVVMTMHRLEGLLRSRCEGHAHNILAELRHKASCD